MKKEDCIFCKIAGGEIPSNTIYENSEKELKELGNLEDKKGDSKLND